MAAMAAVGPPMLETAAEELAAQPLASVTVTEYAPAATPGSELEVLPDGDQRKAYGAVPPEAEAEAEPLELPQVAGTVDDDKFKRVGCAMVTADVAEQLFASVTTTE
jgi:hypothetical protein